MQNQSVYIFIITLFLGSALIMTGCGTEGGEGAKEATIRTGDAAVVLAEQHGNVIARVGDQDITFNELNTLMNSSAVVGLSVPALGTPERDTVRITVLDKFISSNLLYLDAIKQGVDKEPGYQRDIRRFSDAVLAGLYWDRQMAGEIEVTEDQIQAMFKQKAASDEVLTDEARNLIVSILRKAQREAKMSVAQQQLREGATWTIHEENMNIKGDEQRADDVPLAEVNGEVLTWGELKDKIIRAGKGALIADMMAMEDDARKAALEREIDLRILVQKAKADGLENNPLYQRRFNEYSKTHLINTHRDRLLQDLEPDDETLQAYYEQNKVRFILPETRKLQMVVVEAEPQAAELKANIEAGELTMFQAARDHSIAVNAGQNLGEVGWVNQGELVPELDEMVFALEPGEIGGPVVTPAGWHLVLVQDVKDAVYTDFAELTTRNLVRRRYLDEKLNAYTVELRKNAFSVEVYQDNLIRLAQLESDMVGAMSEKAQQPGSVTKERIQELQQYLQPSQ